MSFRGIATYKARTVIARWENAGDSRTLSWSSFAAMGLVIACIVAGLGAGWEVITNNYLAQDLPRAAWRIFVARYSESIVRVCVVASLLALLAGIHYQREGSLRKALARVLLALVSALAIEYLLSFGFYRLALQQAQHEALLMPQAEPFFGRLVVPMFRVLFRPVLMRPDLLANILGLPQLARWIAFGISFGFGLIASWCLWRVGKWAASRLGWAGAPASGRRRLPLFSTRFAAFTSLVCLLIAGVLARDAAPGRVPTGRHNVLLISIDTLRADHLSYYGYERPTSPNLDALAKEGVVFDRAISQAPWTLPSHASMFTGLYPPQHGCNLVQGVVLNPRMVTVAERLLDAGYRTAAVTSNIFVSPIYGLEQGFETFDFADGADAQNRVDAALGVLDRVKDDRFFLFLHLMDPHDPYSPPWYYREKFVPAGSADDIDGDLKNAKQRFGRELKDPRVRDVLRRLYDGEILYADDQLRRLFDRLRALGKMDDTLIIVTSDHGESLGEEGHGQSLAGYEEFGHGGQLYNQDLHVPLIISLPGGVPAGLRIPVSVEASVTIMDTIASLTGIGGGANDLSTYWRNPDAAPRDRGVFSETHMSPIRSLYGVQDDAWKLIMSVSDDQQGESLEFYDLTNDWGNSRDLMKEMATIPSASYVTKLSEYTSLKLESPKPNQVVSAGSKVRLTAAEYERLKALGYIR